MASEVDAYNLALSNIAAKAFVQSLTEDSNERKYCSANFNTALETVLEDHDWGFASAYKYLALTINDAEGQWIYQYAYPSDCIKVREIMRDSDDEAVIPYKKDMNSGGTGMVIHTDKESAKLRYTKKVANPVLFTAKAFEALGWKLSTMIAIPLTGNLKLKQGAETSYLKVLAEAKVSDISEGVNRDAPTPTMISIRS